MPEASEIPISETGAGTPKAPQVVPKTPEAMESSGGKVDMLMVFGQGPVKPLLKEDDLDDSQKVDWAAFKQDPLHSTEPDFRVIEGEVWTKQLNGLTEKQAQAKIAEWQEIGRFGLNRWGRENAFASGFALVSGYTDKVLLSGGKTIPGWVKDKLPPSRIEKWPSEARLMADIIRRRFGSAYQEKYGKPIDEAMILEDASTNTLENLANSINANPDLLKDESTLGLLATNFHIDRSEKITALFASGKDIKETNGSQDVLVQRVEERIEWREAKAKERDGIEALEERVENVKVEEANITTYRNILEWMIDPANPDLIKRQGQETRWSNGLVQPEYIKYWFGYIGKVEDPIVLQATIQRFKDNPEWSANAQLAFKEVGLSFDDLASKDLTEISKEDFTQIAGRLEILSKEGYRVMPPPPSS